MKINSIVHASLIIQDTKQSLQFYCNILGLEVAANRPDLGYPGAWLQVGDQQIHLLELPNPDPVVGGPEYGGRDHHVALSVENIDQLRRTFEQNDISFTSSKSGRQALFVRDPDGNTLEFIAI